MKLMLDRTLNRFMNDLRSLYNVLMVSDLVQKRAFPIFWTLLDKQGASNLAEQQQVLRPVIRLLKRYKLALVGDRNFTA